MNAPLLLTEADRAKLLVEAAIGDIERMDRQLAGCNLQTDPDGDRGAALESGILEQQAILLKEAAELLGVSVERFCRAAGL